MTPIDVLVDTAKLRCRIERDYEELKSELGLAHFEGRSWRGFHHHAALCIAAYGLLIRERAAIPPRRRERLAYPRVPDPEAPPIRAERHIENSIATIRRQITVVLARTLMRCPCCQAKQSDQDNPTRVHRDAVELASIGLKAGLYRVMEGQQRVLKRLLRPRARGRLSRLVATHSVAMRGM
jgi:hypothetical protein